MPRKTQYLIVCLVILGLALNLTWTSQAQAPISPRDNPEYWPVISGVVMVPPTPLDIPPVAQLLFDIQRSFDLLMDVPLGPNVRTNQDATVQAQNEPSIAVNPTNPNHVVGSTNDYRLREIGGDVRAGYYASFDGGRTWPGDGIIDISTIPNTFAAGDPAMAIYNTSHVYFSYIAFNRDTDDAGGVFVSRSTDGGLTWLNPVAIAWNSFSTFHDKEYITVDDTGGPYDGNVYVSWTRFASGYPIYFSRSTDEGQTWSNPFQISSSFSTQGSLPRVGPNGVLYVTWYDYSDQISMVRSDDGGQSFGTPFTVANINSIPSPLPGGGFRDNSFPAFAIDQTTGTLYVSWADFRNGDADIYFTSSSNGGSTWSTPTRLNDDPLGNDAHQFFPWMDVSPNGTIYVGWFDSRNDPTPFAQPMLYDEYVVVSDDGGLTFSANTRISEITSDSSVGPFSPIPFIGDYSGLAATDIFVFPMWVDTRNGHQDGYTQELPVGLQAAKLAPALVDRYVPFSYTLSMSSEETSVGSSLVDPLPEGVEFLPGSLYASSGLADFDGTTISWSGDLVANEAVTVTFAVTPTAYCSTLLTNLATLTDGSGFTYDLSADSLISGTLVAPSFEWLALDLGVTFTNTTSGSELDFVWDFGDGLTSTEVSPFHEFSLPGTYTVTLDATDACGTGSNAQLVTVDCPDPTALFTWEVDGLTIAFTNESSGTFPLTYTWDFGDGFFTTDENPTHTYARPAEYTVSLTVTEACGVTVYTAEVQAIGLSYLPMIHK